MATNRDIVETRKLNKRNKASLGRGGDTEIREVDGRESHVNALEAYLIDVNGKAGEEYAKEVGAGTTNPLTGMPEYQMAETLNFDKTEYMRLLQSGASDAEMDTFWEHSGITEADRVYFESNINKDYLGAGGFIAEEKAETEKGIGEQYRIGSLGVEETRRGATEQYGLGMGQAMQAAGTGLMEIKQQTDVTAGRSGLATRGAGIAEQRQAEGNIWEAYKMQGKGLAEAKRSTLASADITEAGLTEAQRSGLVGADITSRKTISDIGQTAQEEYWETAGDLELGLETGYNPEGIAYQSHDPDAPGYVQEYKQTWRPSEGSWGIFGQSGATKTCVLSTAAYQQDLITKEQLMSFVRWRLKTQSNHFLSNQTWLGYQIIWKPISKLMLRYKSFAKFITNTLLKGWMNVIKNGKGNISYYLLKCTSLIGYILNRKKALALGKILMANPKAILKAYKDLIRSKELGK